MNRKSIVLFSRLFGISLLCAPLFLLGQTSSNVRQKFDNEVALIETAVGAQKTAIERLKLVEVGLTRIKAARLGHENLEPDDELYMDEFSGILSEFPRSQNFKTETCPSYRRQINKIYKTTDSLEETDEAFNRAIAIFNKICPS